METILNTYPFITCVHLHIDTIAIEVKSTTPNNEAERNVISQVLYASTVTSLIFTMIYIRPNIAQSSGSGQSIHGKFW